MFAWPGDTTLFVFLCVLKMALTAVSSKAVIILLLIINPTHKQEFETISKQHVNNSHLMHNSLCCSSFFSAKPLLQCYQFATLRHIAISLSFQTSISFVVELGIIQKSIAILSRY